MADFTRGAGVSPIQTALHVAATTDFFAQHDDHEALKLASQAEQLLSQRHGVRVVVNVCRHPGDTFYYFRNGHVMPAEEV